ncbi:hypothetical protein HAX54_048211 [Datura stramonium]|uniref:Bulb-type lectin domain-containing protein n=1 Tax=Datura stramonium TaxID=4076 RepID=A0ABS8SU91_DATST|nr:hypothetical protein [Datura stramonium]
MPTSSSSWSRNFLNFSEHRILRKYSSGRCMRHRRLTASHRISPAALLSGMPRQLPRTISVQERENGRQNHCTSTISLTFWKDMMHASVLSEAIEYIKFLHEQVNQFLSTPYMKSGASMQHQQVNGQVDTITTTQFIKDGETIVSSDGTFELGFFSPGNTSTNRYVGIWYKQISVITPVWVANRLAPHQQIWSLEGHPSRKVPYFLESTDDPAPGDYTYHCDPTGYPQDLMRKGPNVIYRAGPWNGLRWSGAPNMVNNSITSFGLIMNSKETYYKYELVNKSVVSALVVKPNGNTMRMIWIAKTRDGLITTLQMEMTVTPTRIMWCIWDL